MLGMAGGLTGEVEVGLLEDWVAGWLLGWTGGCPVGYEMSLWGGKGGHRTGGCVVEHRMGSMEGWRGCWLGWYLECF